MKISTMPVVTLQRIINWGVHMLITEWQEKFLQLITEGRYSVFPPRNDQSAAGGRSRLYEMDRDG